MMTEAILVALITGACAVISQIVVTARSTNELFAKLKEQSVKADMELEKKLEITAEKIDELSRHVELHNRVVERVYKLEQDTAVQGEQISNIIHQLKG